MKLPQLERKIEIFLHVAREGAFRSLLNQCNLAKCCILEQTLLFSTGEQRQFFKAVDIHTTNDVLRHFHHDQTQKKSQTYLCVSLFGSPHVSCSGGRRGMWKSRPGTNQNRHPAVSTCKMATGRLEQFSSARLKGTDFHKHAGARASGRAQFPAGRRQAPLLEILRHVLNSKHVRTAVDFSLCSLARACRTRFPDVHRVTRGGDAPAERL